MDWIAPLTLFLLATAAWGWWTDRSAAERAEALARKACSDAGVIWLDQSVQRVRKRLARNVDGRLSWRRDFDFEFSTSGQERQIGRVSLLGLRVVGMVGPERAPLVYVDPRSPWSAPPT